MIDAVDRLARTGHRLLALGGLLHSPGLPAGPALAADPLELLDELLYLVIDPRQDADGDVDHARRTSARIASPSRASALGVDADIVPFGRSPAAASRPAGRGDLPGAPWPGSASPYLPTAAAPRRPAAGDSSAAFGFLGPAPQSDGLPHRLSDLAAAHGSPALGGDSESSHAIRRGEAAPNRPGASSRDPSSVPGSPSEAVTLAPDAVALAAALGSELRPHRRPPQVAPRPTERPRSPLSAGSPPDAGLTRPPGPGRTRPVAAENRPAGFGALAAGSDPHGRGSAPLAAGEFVPSAFPQVGVATGAALPAALVGAPLAPGALAAADFAPSAAPPTDSRPGEFAPVGGPTVAAPKEDAPATAFPPIGADDLMDRLTTEFEFEFLRRYGRSGGGR